MCDDEETSCASSYPTIPASPATYRGCCLKLAAAAAATAAMLLQQLYSVLLAVSQHSRPLCADWLWFLRAVVLLYVPNGIAQGWVSQLPEDAAKLG
jgi:hypothetical protein